MFSMSSARAASVTGVLAVEHQPCMFIRAELLVKAHAGRLKVYYGQTTCK
jgi:hypothetical protein